MIHIKKGNTLSTMDIFRALAFIALGLSILSGLMLSLVLLFSGNLLTRDPLQTCQAALRPVACESAGTARR